MTALMRFRESKCLNYYFGETYTSKHGSHAQTVALVSVGQVGKNLGCGRNCDSALVSDF